MAQGTNTNLQTVADGLRDIGLVVKILGMIVALAGLLLTIAGIIGSILFLPFGIGLLIIGVFMFVGGVLIAAVGEVLLSLVSIEANIYQVNQTIQMATDVSSSPAPAPTHKFCRDCRTRVDIDATFCENCGGFKFQIQ